MQKEPVNPPNFVGWATRRLIAFIIFSFIFPACEDIPSDVVQAHRGEVITFTDKQLPDGENGIHLGMNFDEVKKIITDLQPKSGEFNSLSKIVSWDSSKFINDASTKLFFDDENKLTWINVNYTCNASNEAKFLGALADYNSKYGNATQYFENGSYPDKNWSWSDNSTKLIMRYMKGKYYGYQICEFEKSYWWKKEI